MADFILKLIQILIWPAVAIFAIVYFRKPLIEIITTLKRLKYKELEIEFEKETYQLLEKAEDIVISDDKISLPSPEDLESEHERRVIEDEPPVAFSMKKMSPLDIITYEWDVLEESLQLALKVNKLKVSTFNVTNAAQILAIKELIRHEDFLFIVKLQNMRNRLIHNIDFISEQAADNFAQSVRSIKLYIDSKNN
ncbi:MAG: hypothetical protein ACMZ63_09650 [Methylotenera sp.]